MSDVQRLMINVRPFSNRFDVSYDLWTCDTGMHGLVMRRRNRQTALSQAHHISRHTIQDQMPLFGESEFLICPIPCCGQLRSINVV